MVNFKSSSYLETLEKGFKMVHDELLTTKNEHLRPSEIIVIGVNYDDNKIKDKMKENILRWCLEKKQYFETITYTDVPF